MWSNCLFSFILFGLSAGSNVPIGAIFNTKDETALTAFKYALWAHNTNGTEPPPVTFNPFIEKYFYDDVLQLGQSVCRLLRQGIYTAISPTSVLSFKTLTAYSNAFSVPLLSPGFPEINEKAKFGVSLKPSTTKAIADILKFYKWESITYLYDSDEGPIVLQQLMKYVPNLKLDTGGFRRVYDADGAILILRQFLETNTKSGRKIVLATEPKLAKEILMTYIRDPNLRIQDFHFLLTHLTTDDTMTSFGSVPVTHLRLVDPGDKAVKEFYKTWRNLPTNLWPHAGTQEIQENALLTYDATSVLINAYVRLFNDDPHMFSKRDSAYLNKSSVIDCSQQPAHHFEHGSKIIQYIKETHIPNGLTGNIMFDVNGNRRDYTLHVIESSPMEPILMGIWSDLSGLKVIHDSSYKFQGDNSNLPRSKVIITSILMKPFLMMKNSGSGNDRFEGYVKDLTEYLTGALNIDYELHLVKDSKYGLYNPNTGEWSGMIGEVGRGEADWAVAPLTITMTREQYVDFTKPYITVNLGIVMKTPEKKSILGESTFFFLKTFSYEVWLCIVAAYVAISIITYIVSRFTGSPDRIRSVETKESDHLSVSSSFWFSLGSLMFRGTGIYPRSLSHRFVSAVWWFFSIVVIATYISSLASLLISEQTASKTSEALPYKDAFDVIESTVYTGEPATGLLKGGSTEAFFKNSNSALYQRFYKYLSENPNVMTTSYADGVKKLRESTGEAAFIMEMTAGDYHTSQAPCDLSVLPGSLYSTGHGIAMKKGSPYKNSLDVILTRLHESGNLTSLYHKWWKESSPCRNQKSRKFTDLYHGSLTLSEVSGLFYVLCIGVGASLVAAILEYFCRTRNISLRNNRHRKGAA